MGVKSVTEMQANFAISFSAAFGTTTLQCKTECCLVSSTTSFHYLKDFLSLSDTNHVVVNNILYYIVLKVLVPVFFRRYRNDQHGE